MPSSFLDNLAGDFPLIAPLLLSIKLFVGSFDGGTGSLYDQFSFRLVEIMSAAGLAIVHFLSFVIARAALALLGTNEDSNAPIPFFDNNAARFTLGLASAVLLLPLITQHIFNAYPPGRDWEFFARATPLWAAMVVVIQFVYLVLTRPRFTTESVLADARRNAAPTSVRPIYDGFTGEARPAEFLAAAWREPVSVEVDEERDLADQDLKRLASGEALLRVGTADARMYRMLSEAVFQAQDRGELAIVVCPERTAERVHQQLLAMNRTIYPETIRRHVILDHNVAAISDKFDASLFYDLIIAEEKQFAALFKANRAMLTQVLHRVGLFVFIDFHAIDASLVHPALKRFERREYPNHVGVYFQSIERKGLEEQIKILAGDLGVVDVQVSALVRHAVPAGWIVWKSSEELRAAMLRKAGLAANRTEFRTAPYLALSDKNATDETIKAFPKAVLISPSIEADVADLRDRLRADAALSPIQRTALDACWQSTMRHLAPSNEPRILLFAEAGAVTEMLNMTPSFWAEAPDFLVHVIISGHLGMSYLVDRIKTFIDSDERNKKLEALQPLAQIPGVGSLELCQMLIDGLVQRDGGLSETEARRYLSLVSGQIESYLDVSVSRRGLERLLKLVLPDFHHAIIPRFDANGLQQELYSITAAERTSVLASTTAPLAAAQQDNLHVGERLVFDEGLLFHKNGYVRTEKGYARISEVTRDPAAIKVELVGRNDLEAQPEPVYHYRRHYNIVLGERDKPEKVFVFEDASLVEARSGAKPVEIVLLQATIRRVTDAYLRRSSDEEPTPVAYAARTPLTLDPISVTRTFRNILLFNLPLGGDEAGGESRVDINSLLSTLAATLQAVLSFSFPALAPRIAVVPISDPDDGSAPSIRQDGTAFHCLFPTGGFDNGTFLEVVKRYKSKGDGNTTHTDAITSFTLAVIEDGEHDLGICRSVFNYSSEVMKRWQDFLEWASQSADWNLNGKLDPNAALACGIFGGPRR